MNENHVEKSIEEMTVGEILRNARTTGRRKREIATVAKQLCIREEFLQALEDGNYKLIPEVVYILGFARNYAMELGLDPDEIVNKLKIELGLIADCDDDKEHNETNMFCSGTKTDNKSGKKKIKDILNVLYKFVRKNWLWCVIGFVVVLLFVVLAVIFIPSETSQKVKGNESVQVVDNVMPKYNLKIREKFGTENEEKANIILQANQESWVKIEDDRGNTVFSRVLVPGDVYYVPSEDGYKATFGNTGGIDIWVNGKLAPKQGENYVRKSGILMSAESLLKTSKNE